MRFADQRYLDAARMIGRWIVGNLTDTTGSGFGGYFLGYPDEGQVKQLITGKSIENNADIFISMTKLSEITRGLGLTAEADAWAARAQIAGDYVMRLFDPVGGRFYAGTVPTGLPPSPGISPNGPRQGNETVNTAEYLDAQTFVILPMASSPRYRNAIDWRRPIAYMLGRFADTVSVAGRTFSGFNLVPDPTEGPRGLTYEFTAQAVIAMRFVDALYGESNFESTAQFYLAQIREAQQFAPFADGQGLVASVLQDGDLVPAYEQCLSTPFQCVSSRVGLAATTWAIAADLNINPFLDPIKAGTPGGPTSCVAPDPFTAIGGGVCVDGGWRPAPSPTTPPPPPNTPPPSVPGSCTTPDPFTAIGGGVCVDGGWRPAPSPTTPPPPPNTPPPSVPGSCTTPDPFTAIGGGVCVDGGWRPAPSPTTPPPPPNTPPPSVPGSCTTPDPFTAIGGGVCVDGGWRPAPSPTTPPPPPNTPPPSVPGSCTTPDPFTAIGGGVCVDGGWRPAPSPTTPPPPPNTPPPSVPGSCTTPDPFTAIGGGVCVDGGWRPAATGGLAPPLPGTSRRLTRLRAAARTRLEPPDEIARQQTIPGS